MWQKLKEAKGINTYKIVILRSSHNKKSHTTIANKNLRYFQNTECCAIIPRTT